MAGKRAILLVLGLCLTLGPAARAGVYSTVEFQEEVLNPDFRPFQAGLVTLRGIGSEAVPTLVNKRHLLVGALAAANPARDLTVEQRLNTGAYLIRLSKYDDAIQVLKPALAQEPRHFLILSNLAAAYHGSGEADATTLAVAHDYLSQALRAWPVRWEDLDKNQQEFMKDLRWTKEQFAWYRRADTTYGKLLQLRAAELQQQGPRVLDRAGSVDALFVGGSPPLPVRFLGESGKYEAGTLAAAERAKLPDDALLLVEQLLVWRPNDLRLYWLLGELLNAQGQVAAAKGIFNELVSGKNARFGELLEHRRVLLDAAANAKAVSPPVPPLTLPEPQPPKLPSEVASPGVPGFWQTLGVGFLAGLVVAFLGSWQLREIRRRRGRAVPSGP